MKYKRLRLGLIGGGIDSMIGPIHRYAARLDNCYELVGGAFSRDKNKSLHLGEELGLDETRIYKDYRDLIQQEATLSPQARFEVIGILTPNADHFPIAKALMEADYHLILEKPITTRLTDAIELQCLAESYKRLCCVTYTYAGYPMIKEAKHLIQIGKIGKVKRININFSQDWLLDYVDKTNKQAKWRQDPALGGIAGTMGDIGVHAFHLAEYISGLEVTEIAAELNTFVPQRNLDDDGVVLLHFNNGAKGTLNASQVLCGDKANLMVTVCGEKGTILWEHAHANKLNLYRKNHHHEILHAGKDNADLSAITLHNCRLPAGHPEGLIEAFANHYRNFALSIQSLKEGSKSKMEYDDYPKLAEGVRSLAFIEAAVLSSQNKGKWTNLF
ncbi:MAG: Gfo/Idh/MocA family oxidoreductase [Gammaproteobacteria bacterium]|nr:Gfo/Idh/MocA family oxidoreductase [Gammaproteobacteria bacterium]